jgi:hypothetical protein
VTTPLGNLEQMALVSPTNSDVGKLDGMIFDPWERHVCYFVVAQHGWFNTQRYLLPVSPAHIESDGKTLRVDVEPDDLCALPQVNTARYPRMSNEDLISALFSPRAA